MKKLLYFLLISSIYQQSICMNSSSSLTSFWESSPLHKACEEGDVEQLQYWLAQPNTNVNKTCRDTTPLYIACLNSHPECVKLLLATPNINVNKGWLHNTPFHACAKQWEYNEEIIDILASRKDVNIWNIIGYHLFDKKKGGEPFDTITGVLMAYQRQHREYCELQNMKNSLEEIRNSYKSFVDQDSLFNSDQIWNWLKEESSEKSRNAWFKKVIFPTKHKKLSKYEDKLHYLLHIIVLYKRYDEKIMPSLFTEYETTYKQCHTQQKRSKQKESVRQEKRSHHLLRKSSKRMQCTLFLELLRNIGIQTNTEPALLIAHYYAQLNHEMIIAWFYRKDRYYYALPEEQRTRIKSRLLHKNLDCLDTLWRCKK